jgi:F-type H+-transporting ATPase subunit alpha
VLLGDFKEIKEGDQVKRTGRIISVPVGDEMLGASSMPSAADRRQRSHHHEAVSADRTSRPGVVDRQPVKEPLQTV